MGERYCEVVSTVAPVAFRTMSDLFTDEFSFALRQEKLIAICLDILFYGKIHALEHYLIQLMSPRNAVNIRNVLGLLPL